MASIIWRIKRKLNALKNEKAYEVFMNANYINGLQSIFDYNTAIQHRKNPYFERYGLNYRMEGYGIGYLYRRYSGFEGDINCSPEHSLSFMRTNNTAEYRDVDYPVILSSCRARRDIIQPLTDKLVIPCGTFFMPYAKPIYDDFTLSCIKENLGKTLLVYPQHNNTNSFYVGEDEKKDEFVELVEKIKKEHGFDTVLVSIYFADIINQTYLKYEKLGWRVVTAGRNTNYDFGDNAKTMISLADCVIAQGTVASVIQAVYMRKPAMYVVGRQKKKMADGSVDTPGETLGFTKLYEECHEMFKDFSEELTEEQYNWCAYWGGFDCDKTPEEMKLLLEFSEKLGKGAASKDKMRKLASKEKFAPVRAYIEESLEHMK